MRRIFQPRKPPPSKAPSVCNNLKKRFSTMPFALLIAALVMFAMGAWSRWWATPQPYYPTFVSAGLFFATLSVLWPQLFGK
jgi:hypothetical protein